MVKTKKHLCLHFRLGDMFLGNLSQVQVHVKCDRYCQELGLEINTKNSRGVALARVFGPSPLENEARQADPPLCRTLALVDVGV